jgi:anti-anti-sigma factor
MPATTRSLLHIVVRRSPAASQIQVTGELDTASGGELVRATAAAATPDHIDIDLTGVTFADTAGWRALQAACRKVHDRGGTVTVTTSPAVDYLLGANERARAVGGERSAAGS